MLALFVALGGTGYAASQLAKNSVGPRQLRNNAVTSKKVKNFSLRRRDFAPGQVPAGPRGPVGPKGDRGKKGKSGTARAYGAVSASGALDGSVRKNVSLVTHSAGSGTYCILLPSSIDIATTGVNITIVPGGTPAAVGYWEKAKPSCPAGYLEIHTARIVGPTTPGDPATETPAEEPFFFSVP
jgi:hypothetical protein